MRCSVEMWHVTFSRRTVVLKVDALPKSVERKCDVPRISGDAMITYRGLQHYPIGGAELELSGDRLILTNAQAGDGVGIRAGTSKKWEIEFEPFSLVSGQAVSITAMGRNGYNSYLPLCSASILVDEDGVKIGVLSGLMGARIIVKAELNGDVVFTGTYDNDQSVPTLTLPWWAVLLAIAISKLDLDVLSVKIGDVEIIKIVYVTFHSIQPITFKDREGVRFTADHLFIGTEYQFPGSIVPLQYIQSVGDILLTFANINQLTIIGETSE